MINITKITLEETIDYFDASFFVVFGPLIPRSQIDFKYFFSNGIQRLKEIHFVRIASNNDPRKVDPPRPGLNMMRFFLAANVSCSWYLSSFLSFSLLCVSPSFSFIPSSTACLLSDVFGVFFISRASPVCSGCSFSSSKLAEPTSKVLSEFAP